MKYIRRTSRNIKENFLLELLRDRKVINDTNISNFLKPTIENEEDPFNLDHLTAGCRILMSAILNHKTIYLPIDPDCDGVTSAALFYNYCKEVLEKALNTEINIIYHIPEGKEHGVSTIMDWFPENGEGNLIFIIDASSNDYDEHQKLVERGYEICICDHHEAPHYSEYATVINNQLSPNYANKAASGVGIIYKFFEGFEKIYDNISGIQNYLDLVALGEISDVMLMTTLENRFICDYGLEHINNKFFKELVIKQSFSLGTGPLTQIGVAFYITPLINALIRVGNSLEKERLFQAFITPDEIVPSTKRGEKGKVETICTQSIRNCINAKARQKREKEKASELLDIQILENNLDENKILILNADELDTPNTLTGLCAMEVAAKYKKPVLLGRITPDGKEMKGSIRSFDGSPLPNLKSFLQESGLMSYVEGHQGAAGWGAPVSNIDKLTRYANEKLAGVDFNEGFHEVDFIIPANCSYIKSLIFDLDRGKPFYGQGCSEPMIAIENITINTKQISVIGSNQDTLKFTYNDITYIKFKAKDLIEEIKQYNGAVVLNIVGKAAVNRWNGMETPQIQIEELEIKESSVYDF